MEKKNKHATEQAQEQEVKTPETPETEDVKTETAKAEAAEAESTEQPAEDKAAESAEAAEKAEQPAEPSAEDKLKAELCDSQDRYRRMLAEYDNFRKRSQREKETVYSDAAADTIAAFLPVLDNLDRALTVETADEAFKKGVLMIQKQFYDCLEKLKCSEIEAKGEQFDPNLHNAVMHVDDETVDDNTVVEVFQKGFKINDRVIRHAMVKVAN